MSIPSPLRPCGTCAACCTGVFSVADLHPAGQDCPRHVRTFDDPPAAGGCGDYENRPPACRTFACLWKCFPRLPAGPMAPDVRSCLPGSSCPLGDADRPDRLGAIFILKRASQENLRPAGTPDYRLVKAVSLDPAVEVMRIPRAREILRTLAAAGLPAVIAAGADAGRSVLAPAGPQTPQLARDVYLALCAASSDRSDRSDLSDGGRVK